MARLQKICIAACVLQALITIGVPLMQFFLVCGEAEVPNHQSSHHQQGSHAHLPSPDCQQQQADEQLNTLKAPLCTCFAGLQLKHTTYAHPSGHWCQCVDSSCAGEQECCMAWAALTLCTEISNQVMRLMPNIKGRRQTHENHRASTTSAPAQQGDFAHAETAAATCPSLQGLAGALTRGPVLPALHVVAALLLAALMGSFNTQTYLDLNMQ